MIVKKTRVGALTAVWVGLAGVVPISAQLPTLNDKENLGYFVVARSKSSQFGLASDGKTTIRVLDNKGETMSSKLTIDVDFNVTETMPDGKKIVRKIKAESLESAQEPTSKPKNVVIKGKVTGEVEFEVMVSEERGAILLGGRLLNPGALKNPTQFSVEVEVPNSLPEAKKDGDKRDAKELEDKIRGDKVQLMWTDGKRVRIPGSKAVEGGSKEVTGPGISAATIEFSAFKDQRIQLTASPNSSMTVSNPATRPLSEGFSLHWTADLAKDPEGKARLAIEIR